MSLAAQKLEAARKACDLHWQEAIVCVERGDTGRAAKLLAEVSQKVLIALAAVNGIGVLGSFFNLRGGDSGEG